MEPASNNHQALQQPEAPPPEVRHPFVAFLFGAGHSIANGAQSLWNILSGHKKTAEVANDHIQTQIVPNHSAALLTPIKNNKTVSAERDPLIEPSQTML